MKDRSDDLLAPGSPGVTEGVEFSKALGDRYLAYALSTIMSRSLPDVRDGLKPVNRRLLYAMHELKLNPTGAPKKSARIVGDVIGKFHPHGEMAIYETLVRLAQDFSLRYPLIEGQGNFGNIDGDSAASMRYTEAKLTDVAIAMLEGIGNSTIDFKPTYDGSEVEPTILPANFPNLLANGVMGIAVGMATNIPPHNMEELVNAMMYMIDQPSATIEKLMDFIEGPDFPTGGVLIEPQASIQKSYETGRGGFRLRCKYSVEELKSGQYQIIVTEIPYHVQKGKLIEQIAGLLFEKRLILLADVRDESTEDVRIVLVPKSRSTPPDVLMSTLFSETDLETRIPLNMNVIDTNQIPRVMNLKEILEAYLGHRYDVRTRGATARVADIDRRLEILKGFQIVFLNLDEVLKVIRFEDHPKQVLMTRWSLTDVQTESILNMRLRSLQKLEELAILKEIEGLTAEQQGLKEILNDPAKCWAKVKDELKALKQRFGKQTALGARRTLKEEAPEALTLAIEHFIEREPLTLICSKKGWIRTVKGHVSSSEETKYKEGDEAWITAFGENIDDVLVFVSSGRFYTLPMESLPKGRGFGEPLSLLLDLPQEDDIITLFICPRGAAGRILVAASDGRGFIVPLQDVVAQTKNGKQILNVTAPVRAKLALEVTGDHLAVVGQNRRLLIFAAEDLPEMGRGRGITLQKYRGGDLADICFFGADQGLTWRKGTRTYACPDWREWTGKRGAAGRFAPTGFPKTNVFYEK